MQTLSSLTALEPSGRTAPDREHLSRQYAPMVQYLAQRVAFRLPPDMVLEDLLQAGVIGLLDAIEKYDPSRKTTFKTYAEHRIRGAMLDALRTLDWDPRAVRDKERALAHAYATLQGQWGRAAEDEEVAHFLGLDLTTFSSWLSQVRGIALLRLDAPAAVWPEGDAGSVRDVLLDAAAENPERAVEARRLAARLAAAIEQLPDQDKVVLSLYYYEELTFKEVGQVLEVSESWVCRIHTKAMFRLRAMMTQN